MIRTKLILGLFLLTATAAADDPTPEWLRCQEQRQLHLARVALNVGRLRKVFTVREKDESILAPATPAARSFLRLYNQLLKTGSSPTASQFTALQRRALAVQEKVHGGTAGASVQIIIEALGQLIQLQEEREAADDPPTPVAPCVVGPLQNACRSR